ncbi:MAG TPA: ATP-dependent DNA ligase [Pyrinomonadaceae bacterium]|jgi:DNA ligase-1|nr:ATP-dependent DNA ligase [Pyrinomonadaceae bacterium]
MKLSELARVYDRVSAAGGDPKRTKLLAEVFRRADEKTLEAVAHFTLGELVSPQLTDKLGVGPGTIRAAVSALSGKDADEIDREVKRTGDLSDVVAALVRRGRDALTVAELWRRTNRVVSRDDDRLKLIEEVFGGTSPAGAKYFTRMALNQMRIGAGLSTIARALASAFGVDAAAVERLYAMTNDIGLAAAKARRGARALEHAGLTPFRPYQFMNAHKVDDPGEIFSALAGKQIIFEVKYDGARLQIHLKKRGRAKPEVKLYSRRLNDDTAAMPDVVAALGEAWRGGDAIVEGEAVAFDPKLKRKLPFQSVLMRLGRVHGIEEKAREIPLVLYLFDVLYDDGEDLMRVPQAERRARLEKLFRPTERVKMTEAVVTDKRAAEDRFFRKATRAAQEGLVAKDPDAPYVPGRRTEHWLKIKPAFETLDVVIVGGIYGSGRRRGLLSSLIVAVGDGDEYLTVGKVGTGFSEEALRDLTARLEPLVVSARGHVVEIEPRVVVEVDFQDIQKTNRYRAGYVLRIPRFKRERTDKSVREADTLERLRRLYGQSH